MPEEKKQSASDVLAEIMLRKEVREIKEQEAREANYERRNEAQKRQDASIIANEQSLQARCDHRKGTAHKPRAKHIDYNVYAHRYPGGRTAVTCNKCNMTWWQGTTAETLTDMNGKPAGPNHTKLSFADAMTMTEEGNTTNKPSSAEMWVSTAAPAVPTA